MSKTALESTKTESESGESKSTLVSRNITVQGRRTSVRLEPEMWNALYEVAKRERCSTHDVCSLVSMRKKPNTSLTAAIRVFIMLYFRAASTEMGHERAGHGNFDYMRARARLIDKNDVKVANTVGSGLTKNSYASVNKMATEVTASSATQRMQESTLYS